MRKRRISAILAMAVAGSMVLAGCGGSDFTLASETVTLELGEELSNNAADYVVTMYQRRSRRRSWRIPRLTCPVWTRMQSVNMRPW